MADPNYHTIASYEVEIDNVKYGAFTRVSGIGGHVEDVVAKDDSGKFIVNTPGSANANDLTLVRRFNGDKGLHDWFAEVKQKGNLSKPRTGSVRLKNAEGKQIAQIDFEGAWAKGWNLSDLTKDANGNNIQEEILTVSLGDLKLV